MGGRHSGILLVGRVGRPQNGSGDSGDSGDGGVPDSVLMAPVTLAESKLYQQLGNDESS